MVVQGNGDLRVVLRQDLEDAANILCGLFVLTIKDKGS